MNLPTPYFQDDSVTIYNCDCRDILPLLSGIDTMITDPPYELGFMGKDWDKSGVSFDSRTWQLIAAACLPGAPLLAFGGTRTWHRIVCAIEDGGWEIRDTLMWLYGSGFPKSLDISKAIDKAAGAEREVIGQNPNHRNPETDHHERWNNAVLNPDITAPATSAAKEWQGYGTALKPAWEPICLAMKPLDGTFAHNALTHGVAGLNIDGGRIGTSEVKQVESWGGTKFGYHGQGQGFQRHTGDGTAHPQGRWPANLILSHTSDCKCVGTKKVKGSLCDKPSDCKVDGVTSFEGMRGNRPPRGYADANGLEEVPLWECSPDCPVRMLDEQSGELKSGGYPPAGGQRSHISTYGKPNVRGDQQFGANEGGASRFFYTAKASRAERDHLIDAIPEPCGMMEDDNYPIKTGSGNLRDTRRKNDHPTVKPLDLMIYLVKLLMPPKNGVVLDPFMGSGTTGLACQKLGIKFIGIDNKERNCAIAAKRMSQSVMSL